MNVTIAPDLDVLTLRQRVHDGEADAVEPAGDLVAAAVAELAAGVQPVSTTSAAGFCSFSMIATGDAAALIDDRDGVVRVDRDGDGVIAAGERFVDRVVDDLVDEVMETAHTGGADVHAGALAYGFEALEDGDVLGVITRALLLAVAFGTGHVPPSLTSVAPASGRLPSAAGARPSRVDHYSRKTPRNRGVDRAETPANRNKHACVPGPSSPLIASAAPPRVAAA
jgi:hypothetical protein